MRIHSCRFHVRHYELDFLGHVNNAVYVKYMQEAAIAASSAAGFDPNWYRQHGVGWVIRKLAIRYHQQCAFGDELEVTTWVSDMRRSTSHREYVIQRLGDGKRVARARVNWVFVDRGTGQPARIPAEFENAFSPSGELEDLGIRLTKSDKVENAFRYETRRRVQTYELDTVQHVHHAVYLNWIEQAYFDAIRTAGHPIESLHDYKFLVVQGGHEIEYFEPAYDNDEIQVINWICELGRVRGAWTYEIRNVKSGNLLARDYSLGVFIDSRGRPTSVPVHLIQDVVRGPS